MDLYNIDKTWTLFIDRDGVINEEKKLDYILNWGEFKFYEGVKEAFEIFNQTFGRIVIVTNQRGIGKKLMTVDDLNDIHTNMVAAIENAGGRVDKIYFCTDMNNDSINRKPNPGMAFQAKNDFAEIDFSKSIMVGNKLSDMGFGRNANIKTVYLNTTNPEVEVGHQDIDFRFDGLIEFANSIKI